MIRGTILAKNIASCRRGGVSAVVRFPMQRRSARVGNVEVQAAAVPARSGVGLLQLYKESLATSPIMTKSMTCFLGRPLAHFIAALDLGGCRVCFGAD